MYGFKTLKITFISLLYLSIVCGAKKVVDLTYDHGDGSIFWPTVPKFNMTTITKGITDGGFWLEMYYICTADHGSTHIDAPAHFAEGKWHTHDIPIENLIGPGVIVDVKRQVVRNADYRATKDDLLDWERKNSRIPNNAIVLLNTGWSSRYPSRTKVFNTNTPENTSTFHFPGWHQDAITWLTNNRKINVLGIDTPSNDYAQTTDFPVHRIISKQNIPGIENVGFLDKVPLYGSTVIIGAIKLRGGSGGPARVIAMFDEGDVINGSEKTVKFECLAFSFVVIFSHFL